MATLTGLGIRRLRSLFDLSPPIEFRPITVLLGKNSAGKSSFARLFPLLRQSVERKKRSPILWFGDLVDFGSLKQAITRGSDDVELIFDINFSESDITKNSRRTGTSLRYYNLRREQNDIAYENARINLTLKNDSESDSAFTSRLKATIDGMTIDIVLDSGNQITCITLDGAPLTTGATTAVAIQGQILPSLVFLRKNPENQEEWLSARNPFRDRVLQIIRSLVHGNTSEEAVSDIASKLIATSKRNLVDSIKATSGPPSWEAMKANCDVHSWYLQRLASALLAANIVPVIDLLDEALAQIFSGVRYLKPLRATAERYYRRLDLAVSEIDPEGRNFPMFLDSLSPKELSRFRTWTKENLSIDVSPLREGAQLMVMAKGDLDLESSNIADMGFGISQVLPIAAQLWSSSQKLVRNSAASFIVIEQPELHLHPEYQAKLGDVFAGFVKNTKERPSNRAKIGLEDTRLIVETHSQQLVNRLGALIENGTLSPEDVSIILFEPNKELPGTTKCRVATFDKDGVLINWPYGFFEPGY